VEEQIMFENETDNRILPQALAIEMIPVIRRIASRLAKRLPPHICFEDLVSAGHLGLMAAYFRFDASLCGDFRAYAELRIRGAMIDDLRAADPLSRDLRAHSNRTKAARHALENRLGRGPTEAEIAAEMGLTLQAYQSFTARAAVGPAVSLDAPSGGDSLLQIGDPDDVPADEQVLREQSKVQANEAFEALPPRLQQVVTLYYRDEWTLREIGNHLGVTESRICQLQAEALQRMRAHCASSDRKSAAMATKRRAPHAARLEHALPQREVA
jgi:RNA polymerase sigma factor for flagellar operon FliA